jgi:cyanophycin synthetase
MSFKISNTNSQILIKTAQKMGIEVEILDEEKLKLKLSKNNKSHIVTKKSFGINSSESIKLTRNKKRVTDLLQKNHIPTIKEVEIRSLKELKKITLPPFPLVLKPSEGQKAHDVYVGIRNKETLLKTAKKSLKKYDSLILQEYTKGKDLRFFVLNRKVIGIAQRHPPVLTGDGKSTISELIGKHNQQLLADREKKGKRMQNRLLNQPRITWHIANQGLKMSTILTHDKDITVYPISNFQAGGTVETITLSKMDTSIIDLAEAVADLSGLTVCGIDMIITSSKMNPDCSCAHCECIECDAFVLEVNSDPSLRLHEWPNIGKPQPVTKKLLEFIFKN